MQLGHSNEYSWFWSSVFPCSGVGRWAVTSNLTNKYRCRPYCIQLQHATLQLTAKSQDDISSRKKKKNPNWNSLEHTRTCLQYCARAEVELLKSAILIYVSGGPETGIPAGMALLNNLTLRIQTRSLRSNHRVVKNGSNYQKPPSHRQ